MKSHSWVTHPKPIWFSIFSWTNLTLLSCVTCHTITIPEGEPLAYLLFDLLEIFRGPQSQGQGRRGPQYWLALPGNEWNLASSIAINFRVYLNSLYILTNEIAPISQIVMNENPKNNPSAPPNSPTKEPKPNKYSSVSTMISLFATRNS